MGQSLRSMIIDVMELLESAGHDYKWIAKQTDVPVGMVESIAKNYYKQELRDNIGELDDIEEDGNLTVLNHEEFLREYYE